MMCIKVMRVGSITCDPTIQNFLQKSFFDNFDETANHPIMHKIIEDA